MPPRLLILILLLMSSLCFSQSDSADVIIDIITEGLLEEPDNESDESDRYELIEYLLNHPLNLNTASPDELSSIPYLDLSVAQLIINHRHTYGKFFSAHELYSVNGLSQNLVKKILPFMTVKDSSVSPENENIFSHKLSLNVRSRMQYGLQQRKGFTNNSFPGSPYKLYNRLTLQFGDHINAGFLTEKDAGEVLLTDFSSGYLKINNLYGFNKIIVGDYLVEFGQGLSLWGPYCLTKSSDAVNSLKEAPRGIIPYKSAAENRFFRGAAAEYKWEHVTISGFFSKNFFDANIDTITGSILSAPVDGFHRTIHERLTRKTAEETVYGFTLNYKVLAPVKLGFLYYSSSFDKPFYTSGKIYDNGSKSNYYSSYIDLYIMKCNIYTELSVFDNILKILSGIRFSPSPRFSYTFLIRNYPQRYISMHSFSFAEHTGAPNNEFGIYNGFRWRTKIGTLNFYYDLFRFPNALSDMPLPSEGNEFMVSFTSDAFNNIALSTRLKIENRECTVIVGEQEQIVKRLKKSCRFEFAYNFSGNIRIKTRFEYSSLFIKNTGGFEDGYLIFEDLRYQPVSDLVLYSRVMFFKTASFNSAVYEYENDLWGVLRSTGIYGEGLRAYILVRYKLMDKLTISLKYMETYKPGEITLGTGYLEIPGNIDNMLSLQTDLEL